MSILHHDFGPGYDPKKGLPQCNISTDPNRVVLNDKFSPNRRFEIQRRFDKEHREPTAKIEHPKRHEEPYRSDRYIFDRLSGLRKIAKPDPESQPPIQRQAVAVRVSPSRLFGTGGSPTTAGAGANVAMPAAGEDVRRRHDPYASISVVPDYIDSHPEVDWKVGDLASAYLEQQLRVKGAPKYDERTVGRQRFTPYEGPAVLRHVELLDKDPELRSFAPMEGNLGPYYRQHAPLTQDPTRLTLEYEGNTNPVRRLPNVSNVALATGSGGGSGGDTAEKLLRIGEWEANRPRVFGPDRTLLRLSHSDPSSASVHYMPREGLLPLTKKVQLEERWGVGPDAGAIRAQRGFRADKEEKCMERGYRPERSAYVFPGFSEPDMSPLVIQQKARRRAIPSDLPVNPTRAIVPRARRVLTEEEQREWDAAYSREIQSVLAGAGQADRAAGGPSMITAGDHSLASITDERRGAHREKASYIVEPKNFGKLYVRDRPAAADYIKDIGAEARARDLARMQHEYEQQLQRRARDEQQPAAGLSPRAAKLRNLGGEASPAGRLVPPRDRQYFGGVEVDPRRFEPRGGGSPSALFSPSEEARPAQPAARPASPTSPAKPVAGRRSQSPRDAKEGQRSLYLDNAHLSLEELQRATGPALQHQDIMKRLPALTDAKHAAQTANAVLQAARNVVPQQSDFIAAGGHEEWRQNRPHGRQKTSWDGDAPYVDGYFGPAKSRFLKVSAGDPLGLDPPPVDPAQVSRGKWGPDRTRLHRGLKDYYEYPDKPGDIPYSSWQKPASPVKPAPVNWRLVNSPE